MASVVQPRTETHNPLPNTSNTGPLPGVVCVQWVPRGPNGRQCGPYYYRMWRDKGRLRKQYVRPEELEAVRARCALHREIVKAEREALREATRLRAALIFQNRKLEDLRGRTDRTE